MIEGEPRPDFEPDNEQSQLSEEPSEGVRPETISTPEVREQRRVKKSEERSEASGIETALPAPEPTEIETHEVRSPHTISEYAERYYPERPGGWAATALYKASQAATRLSTNVIGKEKIPHEQPFLIVSSHNGGESGRLMAAIDQPIRIMGSQSIHFREESSLFARAKSQMFRMLGVVPMPETLRNVPTPAQEEAVNVAKPRAQEGYRDVQRRDQKQTSYGAEYVRSAVACLLKNEPVVVYPQGLFAPNVADRAGTGGYALIAKEYERVTGQPLPILPIQVRRNNVTIRPPFTLPEYRREIGQSQSDFYGQIAMQHIKGEK